MKRTPRDLSVQGSSTTIHKAFPTYDRFSWKINKRSQWDRDRERRYVAVKYGQRQTAAVPTTVESFVTKQGNQKPSDVVLVHGHPSSTRHGEHSRPRIALFFLVLVATAKNVGGYYGFGEHWNQRLHLGCLSTTCSQVPFRTECCKFSVFAAAIRRVSFVREEIKRVPKLTQDLNLPPFVQRSVGNPERKRISQLTV